MIHSFSESLRTSHSGQIAIRPFFRCTSCRSHIVDHDRLFRPRSHQSQVKSLKRTGSRESRRHCLVQRLGSCYKGLESHLQTVLVPVMGPHRCSRYTCNDGALSLFQGGLLGQQRPCLHQPHPPSSSSRPLSQSFRAVSEQGPSCPDGSTVTGIRHRNFIL